MNIHFDGGLRKNLMAIVVNGDFVVIDKRHYDNDDYEWDALEMALDFYFAHVNEGLDLVGDNNQVIRWINGDGETDSIIKEKCREKLDKIKFVTARWVKRNENLAGRALEYWTRRSNRETEFVAKWYRCERCVFTSLSEKEKSEHFYNEHITNG